MLTVVALTVAIWSRVKRVVLTVLLGGLLHGLYILYNLLRKLGWFLPKNLIMPSYITVT